jgi:hypothetical protein
VSVTLKQPQMEFRGRRPNSEGVPTGGVYKFFFLVGFLRVPLRTLR